MIIFGSGFEGVTFCVFSEKMGGEQCVVFAFVCEREWREISVFDLGFYFGFGDALIMSLCQFNMCEEVRWMCRNRRFIWLYCCLRVKVWFLQEYRWRAVCFLGLLFRFIWFVGEWREISVFDMGILFDLEFIWLWVYDSLVFGFWESLVKTKE